jgi:transposase
MASDPSLPLDLAACHELIRRLTEQNAEQRHALDEQRRVLDEVDASYYELQQERDQLKAELEQFRRWAYGRRTERIRPADGQRHLFELEEGMMSWPLVEDGSLEDDPAPPRRKQRRSQKDKLAHLPTRIIPLDVPEQDKRCEDCGREKAKIGEDERRVLHYRPAVLEVEVYVLPKYACPCCQEGVVSPPPPERILPRSIAGPGLIAEILVSKCGDHLPLYRQEDRFTRLGLYLSRSTLCDWAQAAPIYSSPFMTGW